MPLWSCPACGGRDWRVAVPAAEIESEIHRRERFVYSRLQRHAGRAELKDLTDFMHGGPARLVACRSCGLIIRDEASVRAVDSYKEDENDHDLMRQVYPRYSAAFRNKAKVLRDRLRPGASVLEIGSHLGAFLQVAEEWGWSAVGLDVGRDTSEFARGNGLTVRRETIEDTRLRASSADAVFIWNCFEQLARPVEALESAYRLLRRFGLLVLRVPKAEFYLAMRRRREQWLAWNNLLGFPYLHGYTPGALDRMAARHGFEPVRGFNSELVTMPFAEPTHSIAAEEMAASAEVVAISTALTMQSGTLVGPWTEIVYRKQDKVTRSRSLPDLRFINRGASC